jgi:hypothetical protein
MVDVFRGNVTARLGNAGGEQTSVREFREAMASDESVREALNLLHATVKETALRVAADLGFEPEDVAVLTRNDEA